VVPVSGLPERPLEAGAEHLKTEILDLCRAALAPYKVPASIRIVSGIDVTPSGKLTRVEA
jgi:acyl-coenzyme A synthetase/AMP-(fatty) acid ligase